MKQDYLFPLPETTEKLHMVAASRAIVTCIQELVAPLDTTEKRVRFANGDYMELVAHIENQHRKFTNDHPKAQAIYRQSWVETYASVFEHIHEEAFHDTDYWRIRDTSFEEACRFVLEDITDERKNYKEQRKALSSLLQNAGVDTNPRCIVKECLRTDLSEIMHMNVQGQDVHLLACPEHEAYTHLLLSDQAFQETLSSSKEGPFFFFTGEKPKPRQDAPLIEKFRVTQRISQNNPFFKQAKEQYHHDVKPIMDCLCDAYIDLAKKYKMATSALALGMALPSLSIEEALQYCLRFFPKVWMWFDEPLESPRGLIYAFSYGIATAENIAYAEKRLGRPLLKWERKIAEAYIGSQEVVKLGLDAVGDDGIARWTFSFVVRWNAQHTDFDIVQTITQNWQGCRTGQCKNGAPPCDSCMKIHTWYFSLYAQLTRIVSREFAETEEVEQKSRSFVEEKVTIKLPRPDKPHKLKEQTITHTYEIVAMDALLRKKPLSEREQKRIPRGSWMEKLDPDAYTYMHIHIKEYTRRLPGREEKKMVSGHQKRIPVKLETYFQKVVYVYAKGK